MVYFRSVISDNKQSTRRRSVPSLLIYLDQLFHRFNGALYTNSISQPDEVIKNMPQNSAPVNLKTAN